MAKLVRSNLDRARVVLFWVCPMAYKAIVINVMIASPEDVAAERSIIQTIIHNWNSVNAEHHRTILMPVCGRPILPLKWVAVLKR
jgi:hypothetical protein